MKKIVFIIIMLGVILGAFYFLGEQEVIAPAVVLPGATNTKTDATDTQPTELCFAKFGKPDQNGSDDKYTLRLILDGKHAIGELNFLPAEKDRKIGELEGTVSAVDQTMMTRTADLWWFTFIEGMNIKEELKIIFGEKTASIGFGEMIDRGDGIYVYKDAENISYNLDLTRVFCADLVERVNVESYLRENISELSPIKAVLGGTWYIVSDLIDLEKNSGTVVYEDGHIQEKRNFSYITDEKKEVVSLIIN